MMRILLFLATNLAVLVIASITLKLLGVDRFTGQNYGSLLVFCAVFGFAGSLVSLFISKWMAKMSTGTEIITQPRTRHEQWLLQTVEELSRQAGIKMPEVGIFPAYEANAFATGWNRNDALVAVSQGLLERFSPDEVKAVLAHEIGHVANGDMVTLSLIQGVVNTFVMFFARIFGNFVDKVILKNEEGPGIGYFIATIFAELVLGILASIIVMWFSRKREYRADEAGAQLAGTNAMIGALQRLRAEQGVPVQMPDRLRHQRWPEERPGRPADEPPAPGRPHRGPAPPRLIQPKPTKRAATGCPFSFVIAEPQPLRCKRNTGSCKASRPREANFQFFSSTSSRSSSSTRQSDSRRARTSSSGTENGGPSSRDCSYSRVTINPRQPGASRRARCAT